jgi:hypothetical protein
MVLETAARSFLIVNSKSEMRQKDLCKSVRIVLIAYINPQVQETPVHHLPVDQIFLLVFF